MARGPDSEWFLSGIGQQDLQQPRIPPPGYDIRDVLKGKSTPSQSGLRDLMNESERKEWASFEKPFG